MMMLIRARRKVRIPRAPLTPPAQPSAFPITLQLFSPCRQPVTALDACVVYVAQVTTPAANDGTSRGLIFIGTCSPPAPMSVCYTHPRILADVEMRSPGVVTSAVTSCCRQHALQFRAHLISALSHTGSHSPTPRRRGGPLVGWFALTETELEQLATLFELFRSAVTRLTKSP